MHLDPFWFDAVVSGAKTIEGRLADRNWRVGETEIIRAGLTEVRRVVLITRIRRYATFRELLEYEGLGCVLPGAASIEEGVACYGKIYSTKDVAAAGGVVAMRLVCTPWPLPSVMFVAE